MSNSMEPNGSCNPYSTNFIKFFACALGSLSFFALWLLQQPKQNKRNKREDHFVSKTNKPSELQVETASPSSTAIFPIQIEDFFLRDVQAKSSLLQR